MDPPFNSNSDYNVIFSEQDGSRSAAQIKAFGDTWRWDQGAEAAYQKVVEGGGPVSQAMQAFRLLLGHNDVMAYLAMMAPRLIELHRVLSPTGSIYLHCDPTASHYLKILMDAIFGKTNFQNEVIWWYRKWSKSTNRFLRNHDVLLFYTKSKEHTFNILRVSLAASTLRRFGGKEQDFADENRTRKITTDKISEGAFRPDVWEIPLLAAQSAERLGYPTQKPEALLEIVIRASSKPGDIVLDPFCGCGTAVTVAQRLDRKWIGIDITALAISLIKTRLKDSFGDDVQFKVRGEPVTLNDASKLAAEDKYQFQWWALGLVAARPADEKKGADKGIDGQLFFHDDNSGKTKQIIFSVKGGHLQAQHLRDLRGVIEREKAEIGVLISIDTPTERMRAEAASAGFYSRPGWDQQFPRLQLLTIADIMSGKQVDAPTKQANVTFRKAQRAKVPAKTLQLDLTDPEN